MIKELFKFKKANFQKLKDYGFEKMENKYQFETPIFDGQFNMFVFVNENGEVSTKVIDNEMQDEYTLHLMSESVGEFVGKVRVEFERVLTDVRDKCFEKEVFKSEQAKQIVEYVRKNYGDELEFLWEKFAQDAIWRRKDNNKWYGLMIVLPKRKLGLDSDEVVDIIDLRIEPNDVETVVDNKKCFEAYHMNKKHWFTICLDGSVPTKTICNFIDNSYALAKK